MTTTTPDLTHAPDHAGDDTLTRPVRSLWSDAWRRLRRNKLAMVGLMYLGFLLIVALGADYIAPYAPGKPAPSELRERGTFRKAAWITVEGDPKHSGDWRYVLGTDSIGRDVFSRVIYGSRVSLVVGFIPMVFTLLIGVTIGLISGFAGGAVDNWLMRFTDVVFALPDLLFFIIMQTAFGGTRFGEMFNGLVLLFVTFSLVSWAGIARLVRGQVLSLKEKEFIEAARSVGVSKFSIVFKHILPNSLGPIIVAGAFIVPSAIIAEAVLSFLGIGIRPSIDPANPFPTSWGNEILQGKSAMESQSWMLIGPALAIASVTIAFVAIGDGLRDALDPRQQ